MNNSEILLESIKKYVDSKANIKKSIICTIATPPPNITLNYENQTIPTKQIYVANYLLQNYHRQYKIDGVVDNIEINVSEYDFNNTTSTEIASNHSHPIKSLSGKGIYKGSGTYQTHKDFWFTDTLQAGNEVLVEIVNNSYVVVAQIVRMPSGAKEGA
jgi:hypothetical protein